jgi:hypothetical protein
MTDARRRFSVSTPDWGEAHLTLDAIVAFVDDELTPGAHARAAAHLGRCPECADEVVAQGQARMLLRTAGTPAMPSSLLSSLRSIPQEADLPEPPAGLAMSPDGELVSVLRPMPPIRRPADERAPAAPASPDPRLGHSRRLRLGAGVAVTGLALGALAFGAPSASVTVPGAAPAAEGGSVLGPSAASLPAALAVQPDQAVVAVTEPVATTRSSVDATPADVDRRLDGMAPVYFPSDGR